MAGIDRTKLTRLALPSVAAGALALAGAGCGGSSSSSHKGGSGKSVSMTYILGVSGSPFYEAMACGAKSEAQKLAVSLKVTAPSQFAAAQQTPVLDAAISSHPGALAIVPTDPSALNSGIQQAESQGIKVLTADETTSVTSGLTSQILSDNEGGGAQVADELAKELHGRGQILLLSSPPGVVTSQDQRGQGFVKELKKYPGLQYVGAQYANDQPSVTASQVDSELSRYPHLAGIFADNDQTGIGAASAIKHAGKSGKVKLWEYDAAVSQVQSLKGGTVQGLIAQEPRTEGTDAVKYATAAVNGKPVPRSVKTATKVLDASTPTAVLKQYQYQGNC